MAYIPNPNQSVSGTVGASVVGLPPVNLNVGGNPVTTANPVPVQPPASGSLPVINIGSVITTSQGSVATVIIGGSIAASFTPPANQSVSGTVQTDVNGSVATVIIGGSIAASFTPPANQSVSGTVQTDVRGSVATVIIGGSILTTTGNSSVQVLNFPANQSVSGAVSVSNFPTTQNVSGSVAAWLQSTNASVITVGSPVANQSVSGTVNVGNFPTTQNVSGSVVATQGTNPWIITGSVQGSFSPAANQSVSGTVDAQLQSTNASIITVGQGSVAVAIVSGSIAATFTPPANQSVSGTVGSSVIGHAPVVIVGGSILTSSTPNQSVSGTVNIGNFPANQSVSGTVIANQGTNPWIITGSVQGSFSSGNSSVQVLNFPTNQSVSGEVSVSNFPATQNVSGSIAAWLQSTNASVITVGSPVANQSVSGTVNVGNFPANQSVSGAVSVSNFPTTQNVSGSVVAFQGTTEWTVKSSIAGGIFPISGSVAATITNTNVNVSGSVVAFGFPTTQNVSGSVAAWLQSTNASIITVGTAAANQSVSGTVGASIIGTVPITQSGTMITSLVSTVPSSVIVGASIFGLAPVNVTNTNLNVGGSVVAFQGSGWSGSVAATVVNFPTTQNVSGSVVAWLQSTNASIITVGGSTGNSSVMLLSGTNVVGSVMTLQGTNPWIITGSVQATLAPAANQSVSGTVQAELLSTNASIITVVQGSIAAQMTPAPNQSVSGTVQTDVRGSVATVIIGGSIATATTNSSVMLLGSTNVIGSVMTLQGTNPWAILGSVQGAFSVVGTVPVTQSTTPWVVTYNNSSILSVPVGSVITIQQANSIVGTFTEDTAHTSGDKGIFTLGVRNDNLSSVTGADLEYSPHTVGPVGENIVANSPINKWVQGIADLRVVQGASVTAINAQGASVFTYITAVQIANMGPASVLVTLAGGLGSVLGYTVAPIGGGSNILYPNALKTGANSAFTASISGTSSVLVSAQGFTAKI